jgi:hypothetical protein
MGGQKIVTDGSPTRPIQPPRMVIIAFFDGFPPRYMEKFRPRNSCFFPSASSLTSFTRRPCGFATSIPPLLGESRWAAESKIQRNRTPRPLKLYRSLGYDTDWHFGNLAIRWIGWRQQTVAGYVPAIFHNSSTRDFPRCFDLRRPPGSKNVTQISDTMSSRRASRTRSTGDFHPCRSRDGGRAGDRPAYPGILESPKTGNRTGQVDRFADFSLLYRRTLHTRTTGHAWATRTAHLAAVCRPTPAPSHSTCGPTPWRRRHGFFPLGVTHYNPYPG